MKEYSNMLIAVNDASGPLVEGLRMARRGNCWATVLKVVPTYDGDIDLTGVRDIGDLIGSGRQQEAERLRDFVHESNMTAKVMVETGDVADTIIRVAAERKCDLIVMGARKDAGRLYRYLNGNLVDKVANGAPCSVMVVNTQPAVPQQSLQFAADEAVPAF